MSSRVFGIDWSGLINRIIPFNARTRSADHVHDYTQDWLAMFSDGVTTTCELILAFTSRNLVPRLASVFQNELASVREVIFYLATEITRRAGETLLVRPVYQREFSQVTRSSVLTQEEFDNNEMCSICQAAFHVGEVVVRLRCDHKYHSTCIRTWLLIKATCPTCRSTVRAPREIRRSQPLRSNLSRPQIAIEANETNDLRE